MPRKHIPVVHVITPLPGEEWKPVTGYEGKYSVSNMGRVAGHCGSRWRNQNRILSGGVKENGYCKVCFEVNGVFKNFHVHRLVLIHFGPPSGGKTDCNHKDGNKLNNRLENLEWASRSENMRHAMRTGLWSSVGIRNPQAKLTPDKVREIRALYMWGNAGHLAELFGVCRGTITDIASGKKWRHVA